jgi:hypothetical protein
MSQALQIGQYTTNASAEATIVPLKSVILVSTIPTLSSDLPFLISSWLVVPSTPQCMLTCPLPARLRYVTNIEQVNLLYVKALLTDHQVLLFSPVPRTRTRTETGTGTRTSDRRSSSRTTPDSGLIPDSAPEPTRIATTMRTTMGTLGTETSLPVEDDAVKAESIDSNGQAEDVLHKVFGQHLEVSRLRLRQVRNPNRRRLWVFRTLCEDDWNKS